MSIEERVAQAEARIQQLAAVVAVLQQNRGPLFEPTPPVPAPTNVPLCGYGSPVCQRCGCLYPAGFPHYCVPTTAGIYRSY